MTEKRAPRVAYLEEYDDDQNRVKPGTVKQASHRRASSVRPPQRRDAASDSGYSSQNGVAIVNERDVGAAANTSAPRQNGRSKPVVIQRTSSQRAQQASTTRPEATSQNTERRYTLPKQPQPEQLACWNAYYAAQAQPFQANSAQHAQATAAQPIPGTSARRPSVSTQARPISMHGYIPSLANPYGPPPSPSAYHNYLAHYHQNPHPYQQAHPQPYQQPVIYGSTPPMQVMPSYLPPSPATQAPPHQMTPPTRAYNQYSARQPNPTIPGLDWSAENVQPGLLRSASVQPRQRQQAQIMPGSWDSSETTSESCSEDSEEEVERQRQARVKAKRDSRAMPPPARRPSVHRNSVTVPEIPRASREQLRRAPRSDGGAYDLSSSDNYNSDRTARAVVSRHRTESSHSSRSRRPSISTEGSRGTKQTSLSSGSGYERVIVEDERGRRRVYNMTKEEKDEFIRRLKVDKEQTIAEEYQRGVSGLRGPELTAENIRQASQRDQRRTSGSHMSARSRQSAGSLKTSRTDGIEIKAGGTVLHVYGDAKIEMQAGDDGEPARFVIGGSSRDSAYYGSSKGSSSRVSRRKAKIPEDGYESGH